MEELGSYLHIALPQWNATFRTLFLLGVICTIMLQLTITLPELSKADKEFCISFELLYSKEHCTPNMHAHVDAFKGVMQF